MPDHQSENLARRLSPGGEGLTKDEKDKIYKAIKEMEEKIANFKKAIE